MRSPRTSIHDITLDINEKIAQISFGKRLSLHDRGGTMRATKMLVKSLLISAALAISSAAIAQRGADLWREAQLAAARGDFADATVLAGNAYLSFRAECRDANYASGPCKLKNDARLLHGAAADVMVARSRGLDKELYLLMATMSYQELHSELPNAGFDARLAKIKLGSAGVQADELIQHYKKTFTKKDIEDSRPVGAARQTLRDAEKRRQANLTPKQEQQQQTEWRDWASQEQQRNRKLNAEIEELDGSQNNVSRCLKLGGAAGRSTGAWVVNSCSFPIDFAFCWGDVPQNSAVRCENGNFGGGGPVAAGGREGLAAMGVGNIHFAACRSPTFPKDLRWTGSQIGFRCTQSASAKVKSQ